jgi:hypothetical protein
VAAGAPLLVTADASDFARFIDASGSVYSLVASERDLLAPTITNASIDVSSGVASPSFSWTTSELATTWLDWGLTTSYEIASFGTTLPLSMGHVASPTPVQAGVTYHYRIRSADALGNKWVTADQLYSTLSMPSQVPTPTAPSGTLFWYSGSVPVTYVWQTVTMPDGDPAQYYIEVYRNGALWHTSPWVSGSSWTDSVPSGNSGFTWRVRARDSVHTNLATAFSAPLGFDLSYIESEAPTDDRMASLRQFLDMPLALLVPILPSTAVQVAQAEIPLHAFSVDTDRLALEARSRTKPTTFVAPAAGWVSAGPSVAMPAPLTPGAAVSGAQLAAASTVDGVYWTTSLAAADRNWNWQVARFSLPVGAPPLSEISVSWFGHGEPTAGYATKLYLWDNVAHAWVQFAGGSGMGSDTTMTASISSVSTSYCLSCHSGTPASTLTTISAVWTASAPSDIHGPRVGTGTTMSTGGLSGGRTRGENLSCAVCHSPHGSSGVWDMPAYINGTAAGTTMRDACAACHTGGAAAWHAGCISCHEDPGMLVDHSPNVDLSDSSNCFDCHRHGSKTKWGTVGILGAPGCTRPGHDRACHTFPTTF